MTELSVMFLWHMHQPYYVDTVQGLSLMPWVRLHAVKGYLDMIAAVERCPGARVCMNLTPCLVRQLIDQSQGGAVDQFYALSKKPVSELGPEERAFILRYFFMADWETMIRPFGEYLRLLNKRGTKGRIDFEQAQKKFSDQEITDLVVWFNLAWCGWRALEQKPELLELRQKGRDFTEDDKDLVLDSHIELMAQVLPAYKHLSGEGAVEVSTTPMYHPILPLLYDTNLADRARPGVRLPPRFRRPEDASAQIRLGLAYMEEWMGKRPSGMWPSEGSVAHELAPIFIDNGVRWIATDEGLLFKRLRAHRRDEALFHPWKVRVDDGRELVVFFRDRGLSDLIGFTYSKRQAEAAADDMVTKLREIHSSLSRLGHDHAIVSVVLDGENPWQSYPDGGKEFLALLYNKIIESPGIEMALPSKYLDEHPPQRVLEELPTGSWINQNFDIWIGGPEENKAWDYLGRVREDLPRIAKDAPRGVAQAAWDSLCAAEGSDWFWWYGDQFSSDLDCEFDHIFRMHLKNAYMVLGADQPLFLNEPVIFDHPVRLLDEPMDFISPKIDGKVTDYFEWHAAGKMNLAAQGPMYQGHKRLLQVYFGFDLTNFYLRIDPADLENETEAMDVYVQVLAPARMVIIFPFKKPAVARVYAETGAGALDPVGEIESVAGDRIVELKAPFKLLGMEKGDEVQFIVKLYEAGEEIECHPRDGFISFTVPDESFEARHWSV